MYLEKLTHWPSGQFLVHFTEKETEAWTGPVGGRGAWVGGAWCRQLGPGPSQGPPGVWASLSADKGRRSLERDRFPWGPLWGCADPGLLRAQGHADEAALVRAAEPGPTAPTP